MNINTIKLNQFLIDRKIGFIELSKKIDVQNQLPITFCLDIFSVQS